MEKQELENNLKQFIGCEQPYFDPLVPWLHYTDGARFFIQHAGGGAHWFLMMLGTELAHNIRAMDGFCLVHLFSENGQAIIRVIDGEENVIGSRLVHYTDCPEGLWKFYVAQVDASRYMLMLPGEY